MAQEHIDDVDQKLVKIYYCMCGQSVELVSVLEHAETNKVAKKQFKDAEKWGRKVETITLAEFKEKSFLCHGIPDCPDPNTTKYYPKRPKKEVNE